MDFFGRLTIDSLPFYSAIAASGAAITVLGALSVMAVITYLGAWRIVLFDWVSSIDHKKIGIMYIMVALVMLMRGFIDAAMMRSQQARGEFRSRIGRVAGPAGGRELADHQRDQHEAGAR